MKIVVLAGGISTEREISVVSGTKVCEALRAKGHRAILLDVYFGLEGADVDEAFTEEEYAIAISKDNEELLEKVNGALKTLKDSGKLDEIVAKYIKADAE